MSDSSEFKKFTSNLKKKYKVKIYVFKLDLLRKNIHDFRNEKKFFYKILHISNFGIKTDHRLFNLSISLSGGPLIDSYC